MTELVPLAKELGIKRVIIKMLQLSQVNLLFVPCPFKSVKQNIHSATMSGPQHKLKLYGPTWLWAEMQRIRICTLTYFV